MMTAPNFDLGTNNADVRPARVSNAVRLLIASQALGLVTTALLSSHIPETALVAVVQILTEALFVWLIYKIWMGSNRARIIFAVVICSGVPGCVPILVKFFHMSVVAGSINLIQSLLQCVALFLLYTEPSQSWFKRKIAARATRQAVGA